MWHRILIFCFALFMPMAAFAQDATTEPEPAAAPELIIQTEQIGWNQFRLRPASRLGPGEFEYEWNFGDGQSSMERVVEHAFAKPGRYSVTLRLLEPDGTPHAASIVLRVGFFHLANWRLWLLLGLLAVIIILAAVTAGVSESIVPEQSAKPEEKPVMPEIGTGGEPDLEPLADETGNLDSLASTGEETEALASDLALLEAIGKPGVAKTEQEPEPTIEPELEEPAMTVSEEEQPKKKVAKAKKKTTKKRPSKKRTIKVKEET